MSFKVIFKIVCLQGVTSSFILSSKVTLLVEIFTHAVSVNKIEEGKQQVFLSSHHVSVTEWTLNSCFNTFRILKELRTVKGSMVVQWSAPFPHSRSTVHRQAWVKSGDYFTFVIGVNGCCHGSFKLNCKHSMSVF